MQRFLPTRVPYGEMGEAALMHLREYGLNVSHVVRGGELTEEFDRLFSSLFKKADNHLTIVKALKSKGKGMTRQTPSRIPHPGRCVQLYGKRLHPERMEG